MYALKLYEPCLSFFIGLEKISHFLFATYHKAKEKNKAKTNVILEKKSEVDTNKAYLHFFFENSNLDINNLSSFSKINNNNQDY